MNNIIKAKKRIINKKIDGKGRPVFVIAKFNNYVLAVNCTRRIQQDRDERMILDIHLQEQDHTYLQRGYKIYHNEFIKEDFDPAYIEKEKLEYWFGKWGINKIITALYELIKLDDFYSDEFEVKKLVTIALNQSKLTSDFKNLIKTNLSIYIEDSKSIKSLKEFI